MKHQVLIVLQALLDGQSVKIKDYTYVMSEDNKICIATYTYDENHKLVENDILLNVDYSINDFISLCETLTFEETFLISSSNALTKLNKERWASK